MTVSRSKRFEFVDTKVKVSKKQAFIFGSGVDSRFKQLINIEISKMNRSGLTEQIESDWKD